MNDLTLVPLIFYRLKPIRFENFWNFFGSNSLNEFAISLGLE